MEKMKNLKHTLHFILVAVLLTACSSVTQKKKENGKVSRRVKVVERGVMNNHYDIIEIDGCQYVSNSWYGGITHLENCKNKH